MGTSKVNRNGSGKNDMSSDGNAEELENGDNSNIDGKGQGDAEGNEL